MTWHSVITTQLGVQRVESMIQEIIHHQLSVMIFYLADLCLTYSVIKKCFNNVVQIFGKGSDCSDNLKVSIYHLTLYKRKI